MGFEALKANTASANTAVGASALGANISGQFNTAVGSNALSLNTGGGNTAVGHEALKANLGGVLNTALGRSALITNTSGFSNTAVGSEAMFFNTGGTENTAVGEEALANSTGDRNIGLGWRAGWDLTTGSNNVAIGNFGVAGESNTIRIGTSTVHTRAFIAGIHGKTSSSGIAVFINSSGQLGTTTSSVRAKEEIKNIGAAGGRMLRLRPVQFRYRPEHDDGTRLLQYGLIAEEVAKVFPELVAYGPDGQPETVRYHFLPPLLLGELQRQQKELTELNANNNDLRKQMEQQATELTLLKKQQATEMALLKKQLALVKALISRSSNVQSAALNLPE